MKILSRVAMVFVVGAGIAWLFALFHGFSTDRQLCFNSARNGCGSSISWTDHRVLWLAPVAIIAVFVVLAISSAIRSATGQGVVAALGFVAVAALVVTGANGVSETDCQVATAKADSATANQDTGALVDAILSEPACFSHSDVQQARQYKNG